MLPSKVINLDQLRPDQNSINFIKHFFNQGKSVSAICHGVQPLIDDQVIEGRKLTSYSS